MCRQGPPRNKIQDASTRYYCGTTYALNLVEEVRNLKNALFQQQLLEEPFSESTTAGVSRR